MRFTKTVKQIKLAVVWGELEARIIYKLCTNKWSLWLFYNLENQRFNNWLQAKMSFSNKSDRLWTLLVCLNMIKQQPKKIVVIGKHRNNQHCYNHLILENFIRITKIKIMKWETDTRCSGRLYEWCNDYTSIEYHIVIDKQV